MLYTHVYKCVDRWGFGRIYFYKKEYKLVKNAKRYARTLRGYEYIDTFEGDVCDKANQLSYTYTINRKNHGFY